MDAIKLRSTLATLEARFRSGTVDRKTTYYLALGDAPGEKWTITLSPTACEVTEGKIASADCVLKMPADLFVRMVAGTFKPSAMDLLSGKIKTSNLELLQSLQASFGL